MGNSGEPGRFGMLLQDYRKQAGMTQIQLAGFSTVSVRAIRDLELGKALRPRRETVRLLAEGLRLTGGRRAALELAAGRDADAATFDAVHGSVPVLPNLTGVIIGRDAELATLCALLESGPNRLVTVSGMAGVGKTRLVLALAQRMWDRTRLPVIWVPMALEESGAQSADSGSGPPVAAMAHLVTRALAQADTGIDDLAALIGDRAVLLVLDDFDRAQGRPPGLGRLLWQCPRLRIVLTSRSPHPHPGEQPFQLRPLPVVDPDTVPYPCVGPAIDLMRWHLRQLRPGAELTRADTDAVARICWWLEGIPQALESAAAWSLMTPLPRLADLARSHPFGVASPPSERGAPGRLRRSLATELTTLPYEEARLLETVSELPGTWSLEDVLRRTDGDPTSAAQGVYGLLMRDLVRPVEPPEGAAGTFRLSNLVPHLRALRVPA